MKPRGVRDDQSGSGSILVVAILAAVLTITMLAAPLTSVLAAKRSTAWAADAAALAGADVAIGIAPGVPCDVAATVALANSASLTGCAADGVVVTVRVERRVMGFAITAAATAGPAMN